MSNNKELIDQLKFLESQLQQLNSEAETNKNVVEKLKTQTDHAQGMVIKFEREYSELMEKSNKGNLFHGRSISNPETEKEIQTELQKEITNQIEENNYANSNENSHNHIRNSGNSAQYSIFNNRISSPSIPCQNNELLAYLEAPVSKREKPVTQIRRQSRVSNSCIPMRRAKVDKKSKDELVAISSNQPSNKGSIKAPASKMQSIPKPIKSSQSENKLYKSLEPVRPVIKTSSSEKSNKISSPGLKEPQIQMRKNINSHLNNLHNTHTISNHRSTSCENFLTPQTSVKKQSLAESIPITTNEMRRKTPPSTIPIRPVRTRANSCEGLLTPEFQKDTSPKISKGSNFMGKIFNSQKIKTNTKSPNAKQLENKEICQQNEAIQVLGEKSSFAAPPKVNINDSSVKSLGNYEINILRENKLSNSKDNIQRIPLSKTNSVILNGSEFKIISIESRTRAQQVTLKELENKYLTGEKKLTKRDWQIFVQEYTSNQNTIRALDDEWLSVFNEVLTSNSEYKQDMTEIRKLINSLQGQSRNLYTVIAEMTE